VLAAEVGYCRLSIWPTTVVQSTAAIKRGRHERLTGRIAPVKMEVTWQVEYQDIASDITRNVLETSGHHRGVGRLNKPRMP
jgi:hypothetical protein